MEDWLRKCATGKGTMKGNSCALDTLGLFPETANHNKFILIIGDDHSKPGGTYGGSEVGRQVYLLFWCA